MTDYALGVDLGTTYTAAAVSRGTTAEPLTLGIEAAQMPSVVLIREPGEGGVLVGDAAERRSAAEPTRTAREFKRRLGDPVPIVIGGEPYSVEALTGMLLGEVVRRATEQEGEGPAIVVLTHPANYSDYKSGLLRAAAEQAGLRPDQVVLLSEPEAAAIAYSRQARIDAGEIVAVYDFGGGTFDAALVRRSSDRFELIGVPEGMERLGGIDFDQAVLAHVDATLGGLVSGADRNDPLTLPGQARLRTDCRRAKETLSTDGDTTIPVSLPGVQTEVRLTRDEFESMIRPRIGDTIRALERTVASAGITIGDVARILLVGGTSRMPVVAEMLRAATDRPVAVDAHPKLAIAVGAALSGAGSLAPAVASPPGTPESPAWKPAERAPTPAPAPAPAARSGKKKGLLYAAVGGTVGLAAVVGAVALGGGNSTSPTTAPTTAPAASTASTIPTPATSVSVAAPPTDVDNGTPPTLAAETPSTTPGRGLEAIVSALPLGDGVGVEIVALTVDQQQAIYAVGADAAVIRVAEGSASVLVAADPAVGMPGGLVVAPDGSVLVSTANGVRSTAGGTSTLLIDAAAAGLGATPGPLAFDGVGNLYLADNANHRIVRRGTDGSLSLIADSLGTITGLAIDSLGNLLYADSTTLTVGKVAADGTLSTLAGGGALALGGNDQPLLPDGTAAGDARFGSLDGLAVDPTNNIYVTDTVSGAIVRIDANGIIAIVIARQPGIAPADGVAARDSSVTSLGAITVDRSGNLTFEDGRAARRISLGE